MLRIIGILIPALVGAALVWFLVPAGGAHNSPEVADASVEHRPSEEEKKALSVAFRALMGSPNDVYGKPLAIIIPDTQLAVEDFEGADAKYLAKAHLECQVVSSPVLYRQYLESVGEAPDPGEAVLPDEAQVIACAALVRALNDVLSDKS